jgi:hypothetical protein
MKKISETRLGEMKETIYENMFRDALDEGFEKSGTFEYFLEYYNEAEEAALDYANSLTDAEIIKKYKEITE